MRRADEAGGVVGPDLADALMGIVAGVLASRQGPAPAKDFRTDDRLPGFAALQEFLAALAVPAPASAAGAPCRSRP